METHIQHTNQLEMVYQYCDHQLQEIPDLSMKLQI